MTIEAQGQSQKIKVGDKVPIESHLRPANVYAVGFVPCESNKANITKVDPNIAYGQCINRNRNCNQAVAIDLPIVNF